MKICKRLEVEEDSHGNSFLKDDFSASLTLMKIKLIQISSTMKDNFKFVDTTLTS